MLLRNSIFSYKSPSFFALSLLYEIDHFLLPRRIYCALQVTGDFEAVNNHSYLHVSGVLNPFMLHVPLR
jgi:hypothetical protein